MFINPRIAIEKGWIKGIKDEAKQVQPNAIDFTLDKVQALIPGMDAFISEREKVMRPMTDVEKTYDENWVLQGGRVYDGTSDMYVEVPEGVAAILYTRSTFARNGVFIMSGLYDSGFKGHIGFTIYTVGGLIVVAQGTRIGQIAFIHSENAGMYAGGYNHEIGTPVNHNSGGELHKDLPTFGNPSLMEAPIAPGAKGELAKDLERTHTFDSLQGGKPAGTKTFL